jgi:hypothetical protein
MWHQTFAERLESWTDLRQRAALAEKQTALYMINHWWFGTHWRAYHLHWDDQPTWPDPWQLLSDDIYCPLARGLGILYTIAIIDRADLQDVVLAEHGGDNLVLVDKSKYILNWEADTVVNINLEPQKVRHSATLAQINQQLR